MKIIEFELKPYIEVRFLNAGRGPGMFTTDRLPVHVGKVDQLPDGLSALIVTADLQGRETFHDANGGSLKLLGEVLPQRLVDEILPLVEINDPESVGVLLAGDFYTVPDLGKRGGSGNVSEVWRAFCESFKWVVGVAGNHDTFGEDRESVPRFSNGHYLDGGVASIDGCRIGGVGGIIGNPKRLHRRTEEECLFAVEVVLEESPDVLIMHDGPNGAEKTQRGIQRVQDLLLNLPLNREVLTVRGHSHWDRPLAELANGSQVLNVDQRVVILTQA